MFVSLFQISIFEKTNNMRKVFLLCLYLLAACSSPLETPTGRSEPDLGWLFLDKGPYTLATKVEAAPGAASFQLVTDLSLMAAEPAWH